MTFVLNTHARQKQINLLLRSTYSYFCSMFELIKNFLAENIHSQYSDALIDIVLVLFIAAVSVAVFYASRFVLGWVERHIVLRTATTWDDYQHNPRFL